MSFRDACDIDEVGSFKDADGNEVRCIDDVTILCASKPDGDDASPYTIPEGTQATVLLFGQVSGWVQLEHYAFDDAVGITYARIDQLRLHTRYEQKQRA